MKNLIKKIIIKIGPKSLFKKKSQRKFLKSNTYNPLTELLDAFNSEKPAPEILLFGDSTIIRISDKDTDQRTFGELFNLILK